MIGNELLRAPGVYPVENPIGGAPLQPAGSAAAGFVGTAEWGPMGEAMFISSWPAWVRMFGADMTNGYLAMGAGDFFRLGGHRLYTTRTCHYTDITDPTTLTAVKAIADVDDGEGTPTTVFTVTAKYYGTFGNKIKVVVENVDAVEHSFDLIVYVQNANGDWLGMERWRGVVVDDTDENYFIEDVINGKSSYIVVDVQDDTKDPDEDAWTLTGGDDGLDSIADGDYIGDAAGRNGLYAFDPVTEGLSICHPGITASAVLVGGESYVYNSTVRRQIDLYLGDLPLGNTPQETLTFVGSNLQSNGYEAFYYPWVVEGTTEKPVAPYMAGVYAKNDAMRGVWQAPAGTDFPLPVTELDYDVSFGDIQLLNPHGINCIEHHQFEGTLPWGARTLDVHTHFRYINVRRFVNVIKKTLMDGALQFVFDLNAPETWARVEDTAHRLLMYFHSIGAFAGKTPEQAFFAKCDATTNPPELIDQGVLTCVIGICPPRPAEFVVFEVQLYNEGVLPIATTAAS